MRILVVVHGFPPDVESGSEVYAHDLVAAMQRGHGDTMLVLTRDADATRPEYDVRIEPRAGLTVVAINNTYAAVRSFEESYRNERLGEVAATIVDDFHPDIAHIHHLTSLSTTIVDLLTIRDVPVVLTLHDYWLMCHRGQLLDTEYRVCSGPADCDRCVGPAAGAGRLAFAAAATLRRLGLPAVAPRSALRRLVPAAASTSRQAAEARRRTAHMRAICDQVAHLLAPSRAMRERFIGFGVAPDRIAFSPYGFDKRPFSGIRRSASDRLRVGFLGSLIPSKGPRVLLDAVRRLPAGLVSVDLYGAYAPYHGDDSDRARLDALIEQTGAREHGRIPHARVAQALAGIDVLAVPSIWPENSPLVIGEALSAGVPIVASRIGGIPETINDGSNGLLVEPGSVDELERALVRLLREDGLLETLRLGAASTPVRSIDDDASRTRSLYESLLATRARSRARTSAIVLNYRSGDDTALAVRSLIASRRTLDDIIVVDNDADAAPLGGLPALDPPITYIRAQRNLGYAGGMNLGIREALRRGADRVLLANSDVVVPPDCVERLERALESMPGAGIAGPVVVSRANPDRIASLGMSYDPRTGRMRHRGFSTVVGDRRRLPPAVVVDGVSGCLMLIARDVFGAIGLLDEDYFFSFEDLDFCLRARRAGFATVLAGLAIVHHEGGRSIGAHSPRRLYFAARGHLQLAGRTSDGARPAAAAFRTCSILALNVAHAVRDRGAPLPARLVAVAQGVRDYFRGRFGPDTA